MPNGIADQDVILEDHLKISVLTTDSVPLLGGISDYTHGLMSSTVNEIQWNLRTSAPGSAEEDKLLPYPVHRFAIVPRLVGNRFGDGLAFVRKFNTLWWRLAKRKAGYTQVRKTIVEDRPDAILISRWNEDAHWWCRACIDMGIPYIMIAYGLELVMSVSGKLNTGRKDDFTQAVLVFADSRHVADLVKELSEGVCPVQVLNPGITPAKMKDVPNETAKSLMKRLGINSRFILAMGRLVHRKGFDLAVKAFDMIAEDRSNIDLVIAGDGDDRDEVITAASNSKHSDRIRILGSISDLERNILLQECEFFIMPNRSVEGDLEGFGIVFLQANLYGKAVIGGNNGGVGDAVLNEETGLLVDTSNTSSLAFSITRLLDDKELADSLGRAGKDRVLKEFKWSLLSRIFLRGTQEFLFSTCKPDRKKGQ